MTTLFQTIKNTALFNVLLVVQLKFAILEFGRLCINYMYLFHFFFIHSSFRNSSIKERSITVEHGEDYWFGVRFIRV